MAGNKALLGHYIGTYLLIARGALEEHDIEGAKKAGKSLSNLITGLEKDETTRELLERLDECEWTSEEPVESFQALYEKLEPSSTDVRDVVKKLGG